ncbi:hypothetical protein ABFT23_17880 [Nocardioides sp. C4-1]|uniref:hypothetical protein n=1 Tax=Nocardioides sp. C4-1 TaxID=3151851 RepID=UPI0032673BE7
MYFAYFGTLPPGCNGFENFGIGLSSSIFGAAAVLAVWILIGVGWLYHRRRGLLLAEKEAERRAALGLRD